MDEQERRILAAERAIVELSAAVGPETRNRVVALLVAELETAAGRERDVLQTAVERLQDGKLLADLLKLAKWLPPAP